MFTCQNFLIRNLPKFSSAKNLCYMVFHPNYSNKMLTCGKSIVVFSSNTNLLQIKAGLD